MQVQCICLHERTYRRIHLCACISVQQCMQSQHMHHCAFTCRHACSCACITLCAAMHMDAAHAFAWMHLHLSAVMHASTSCMLMCMHLQVHRDTAPTSVCTCSDACNLQQEYLRTFGQMHALTCMHLHVYAATHAIAVGDFVYLHVQVHTLVCMHPPLHPASHTVAVHAFACMHALTDAYACTHLHVHAATHRCIQVHTLSGAYAHMHASLCMWSSTCDCNVCICTRALARARTNTCNCSTCTGVHAVAGETTCAHASPCMQ